MFELVTLIFIIIVSSLLSLAVFQNNPKSTTNKAFVFAGASIIFWSVIMYLSINPPSVELTLFYIRFSMLAGTELATSFLLLAIVFPHDKIPIRKRWIFLIFTLAIVTGIVAMSPFMFTELKIEGSNIEPVPGPGIAFFVATAIGYNIATIVIFIAKFIKSKGQERSQLKFVLFGILLMFLLLILANFVLVVVFKSSSLIFLGPLFTLTFLSGTAYAILKHKLFNLKVIATETFSALLWTVLFAKIFTAGDTTERLVDSFVFVATFVFGILLIRSVTKEVKQREQLEILTEKLKELDARKDEFLSVAAHELRAPMTAIKGYISMIVEGDTGKLPVKATDYLGSAVEANDRLIRLVNNMLNISRIEEGRQVFNMGEVSLTKVTQTTYKEFEANAKEKNLGYILHIPENISDNVYVDTDRIHEVVANFISNAIKYTDKGEINIKLTQPTPQSIKFEVTDTGAGLSPQEQQKLFTKFYRAESDVGKTMGTGLGLYISKLLIEKFNGKVGITSEKAKGSTFWFELPLKQTTTTPQLPNTLPD